MEITEVRIKLMDDPNDRLQAFCSITFDGAFVIRDLKIIQGTKGSFVAMPSRKLTDRCPRCGCKNHLRSQFCNQCGAGLDEDRAIKDDDGRAKLYADIAHPINSHCREMIQNEVLQAYESELSQSQLPGYLCTYDDYGEDRFATLSEPYEDEIPLVAFSSRQQSSSHRIDRPEPTTGGPHRRSASVPQQSAAISFGNSEDYESAGDDDSFGVGL
ncbi:MAG: SpoVG family protein [Planctomycetota bacterium]|nr:SpoVG family protein [Planctomycetota bacterium]